MKKAKLSGKVGGYSAADNLLRRHSHRPQFNNVNQVDARALAVVTPALISPDYFREIAAIVNAGGPPDLEKTEAVMAKHGLVAVMPKVARLSPAAPGNGAIALGFQPEHHWRAAPEQQQLSARLNPRQAAGAHPPPLSTLRNAEPRFGYFTGLDRPSVPQ